MREDMNRPSRSDHYAMQTAWYVSHALDPFVKQPRENSPNVMRLKFKQGNEDRRLTSQERAERDQLQGQLAKGAWAMRLGVKIEED